MGKIIHLSRVPIFLEPGPPLHKIIIIPTGQVRKPRSLEAV